MTQTFRDHGEEIAFHLAQRDAERSQADGAGPDVRECRSCYHDSHDTRACQDCTHYFCLDCMKPGQVRCWECDNGPADGEAWSGGFARNH